MNKLSILLIIILLPLSCIKAQDFVYPCKGAIKNSSFIKTGALKISVATPQDIVSSDLNNDGKPDLIISNIAVPTFLTILQYSAKDTSTIDSNSFKQFRFPVDGGGFQTGIGDLNGDGMKDLVVPILSGNKVTVLQNKILNKVIDTTSFQIRFSLPVASFPSAVVVQDLNNDNKPEIIVANSGDSSIYIFKNNVVSTIDSLSFSAPIKLKPDSGVFRLEVKDLDGDGKPEIISVNQYSNTISIFKNKISGSNIDNNSFSPRVRLWTGVRPYDISCEDMDGDNKPDIIITSLDDAIFSVYKNKISNGVIDTNAFSQPFNFSLNGSSYFFSVRDMDGDHKPDVVVANRNGRSVEIYQNTTLPKDINLFSFKVHSGYLSGHGTNGIAINDFNSDGKPDFISLNYTDSNAIWIYKNVFAIDTLLITLNSPKLVDGFNVSSYKGSDASIDLSKSGGTFPYTYKWSNGYTTEDLYNIPQGYYTVTVTDVNGCAKKESITLTGPELIKSTDLPQGFTPNGDGINDFLFIKNIETFPDNKLVILNRWGEEVYSKQPYDNTWDGKGSKGTLPEGTYIYVLTIPAENIAFKGVIDLHR